MGEGIIVDDGGSTRIKWMNGDGIGEMETLLNVRSRESKQNLLFINDYNQIRIVWQDEAGIPYKKEYMWDEIKLVPPMLIPTIEINSDLSQRVLIEKTQPIPTITISSTSGAIEPIVEARQQRMKRRYIVSNSGTIQQIKVNGVVLYDKQDSIKDPKVPVIYTSVVLTKPTAS
jgi:hypothetical protein